MATTPKAVRKYTKAKTAARKTFSTYENAAENLKPGSPKKAKEAVRTLAKKDDKAYLRVQKTRSANTKADNRKENKLDKTNKAARRARVMGK